MAIWCHLLRPLLPWLGRIAVGVVVLLAAGWAVGLGLIHRDEPETVATLPPGVPGRLVTAGGHMVHLVEQGEGRPLLLVHGFAGSTYDWEEHVLAPLARSHHVIAIDLLGMGFSERRDDLAYGYDLWTRQLADVLDALGITMATVAGHSLGGAVATIFAGEHPGRVEKLVLVAPLVPLEQSERTWFLGLAEIPGVGEMMLGTVPFLPQLPGFSDAYQTRARQIFRIRGTRQALLTYLRHGRDTERLVAAYRRVVSPTLVVAGTADDVVPYTAVRRWAPAIHDALVLPLDGVGHWVMRDAPHRLVAALAAFDLPAAGPSGQ